MIAFGAYECQHRMPSNRLSTENICTGMVFSFRILYFFFVLFFTLRCSHPASATNKNTYIKFDCLSSSKLIRCIRLRTNTNTYKIWHSHSTPASHLRWMLAANNGNRNTNKLNRMNVMRWCGRNWNMEKQTDRNFQYVIMRTNLFDVDIVCWQLWTVMNGHTFPKYCKEWNGKTRTEVAKWIFGVGASCAPYINVSLSHERLSNVQC